MLKALTTDQRSPLSDNWLLVTSMVIATAAIAVFVPLLAVVPVGGLIFLYFWNHRDKLIVFLLIYTPFEVLILNMLPSDVSWVARYFWEGLLFTFFVMMLFQNWVISRNWKRSIIDKLLILFLISWLLSTIINHVSITLSLLQIKNIIRYMTVFYIVYNLKPDYKFIDKILSIVIVMGVFQAFLCIAQSIEGDFLVKLFRPENVMIGDKLIKGEDIQIGSYYTKFTGSFSRTNELAYYLVSSMSFVIAKYFYCGKPKKLLVALAILVTALILTSSRINWIAAYIMIGVILFKVNSRFKIMYFTVPAALTVIAVGTFSLSISGNLYSDFNMFSRFLYMFTPEYIEIISNMGRLYAILYVAPAVFISNPIFGIGPGSFMQISQQMSSEEIYGKAGALGLETAPLQYVHDVGFVALFAQVGLLGSLAMIGIFIKIYKQASAKLAKAANSTVKVLLLGTIGMIIATGIQHLASFNLMYRNQSLIIWVILGLSTLCFSSRSSYENSRSK